MRFAEPLPPQRMRIPSWVQAPVRHVLRQLNRLGIQIAHAIACPDETALSNAVDAEFEEALSPLEEAIRSQLLISKHFRNGKTCAITKANRCSKSFDTTLQLVKYVERGGMLGFYVNKNHRTALKILPEL